ncbi:methyltransferase [Vibrio gallicus]|uniref:methyltransferase n=1 Tax=Vibrio gallicus TaxID=190897 RepID=UPI0021C48D34|nr:methyltransferase [Vibrio gallicus]
MKINLSQHGQNLSLMRFPKQAKETLQAWDAGDEYIIDHFMQAPLPKGKHILILNDQFGALSCWFSKDYKVTMQTDSHISWLGTLKNLQRNDCNKVSLIRSTESLPEKIDLVLMKIPKNNRYLVWQLSQLKLNIKATTPVIAVNKANLIHSSTLNLFEQYLGQTHTSLAQKKHRLVFSQANAIQPKQVASSTTWDVSEHQITLENLPNVYSGESLDLGARFLLEHLPSSEQDRRIIDLGCGNGVLSVKIAQLNPNAHITSVDESYMAVESARRNLFNNLGDQQRFTCKANNCLDKFEPRSCDLILCNPPFHQQNTITDHIAWQMFNDAKRTLDASGELWVIGNRHLNYPAKLSRLFGKNNVNVVASNSKFVIICATKAIG